MTTEGVPPQQPQGPPPGGQIPGAEKKLVAGILALLVGGLGVHKFYLGYTKEGIIQIVLFFLCGIGQIIAIVEGIIYLTKPDQEFVATYITGNKPWF